MTGCFNQHHAAGLLRGRDVTLAWEIPVEGQIVPIRFIW